MPETVITPVEVVYPPYRRGNRIHTLKEIEIGGRNIPLGQEVVFKEPEPIGPV
jgi:hypothetical protein